MNRFLNRFLRNLKPYRLASHKIWAVSPNERHQIYKLDWNEATIPPSPAVRKRLLGLLDHDDFFHLYPTTNNEDLICALSEYAKVPHNCVQYFASSDSLHEYVCKLFVSAGDPVLMLGPTYDNFRLTCQANGAQVIFSEYFPDFSFDSAKFETDIANTFPALVYMCNPNNPTGYCHSVEYIEYLLKQFPEVLFLIDEAYQEFSGVSCAELVLKYENIIISRTFSKAFALANFRFGYVLASEGIIKELNKIRNPKNITTFTQEAALAALSDVPYMLQYVDEVRAAKDAFYAFANDLNRFQLVKSYGNFVMIEMSSVEEKRSLMSYLESNNIYTRDTTQSPVLSRCFRMTIGTREQMAEVQECIRSYYEK